MSEVRDALKRAQHHGKQLAKHLGNALDAHVNANSEALGKCLREAERSADLLKAAHDALEGAIGTGHDPDANPTAAMGAQTSSGQEPRSAQNWAKRLFSPERTR